MRRDADGNLVPSTFIEQYFAAKQKANEEGKPGLHYGFYVKPDHPRESTFSKIFWTVLFATSCIWGPLVLNWVFGNP
jgi:hypothetical protein